MNNIDSQLTDELQARDQISKESKNASHRPSILDELAGDKDIGLDSNDSADSHGGRRKVTNFRFGLPQDEKFRQQIKVSNLKEAAGYGQESGSNSKSSHNQVDSEAKISEETDGLLDKISVHEP